jgi:uncharacterized membrane-anchored protein YhcB (DUF1043 family)
MNPPVYLLKEALASPLQIHASFNDSSDLVSKLNQDLKHLSKWMGKNKPNSSDYKSKHMPVCRIFLQYKKQDKYNQPILINNIPVPRVTNYKCLGVI